MRLFNLGALEIVFIFVLAVILLGPAQMVKLARDAGKLIARITRSSTWLAFLETSRELKDLKHRIVQEADLDRVLRDNKTAESRKSTAAEEFITSQGSAAGKANPDQTEIKNGNDHLDEP